MRKTRKFLTLLISFAMLLSLVTVVSGDDGSCDGSVSREGIEPIVLSGTAPNVASLLDNPGLPEGQKPDSSVTLEWTDHINPASFTDGEYRFVHPDSTTEKPMWIDITKHDHPTLNKDYLEWSSIGLDIYYVAVKGGNDFNLYAYFGSANGIISGDSCLFAPLTGGGQIAGISHMAFYFTEATVPTTSVTVEKVWNDGGDEDSRPAGIQVELWRDLIVDNGLVLLSEPVIPYPEYVQTSEVFGAMQLWSYTFTNLPKYNPEGVEYLYFVEEVPVEGYASDIDGLVITNTPLTEITVEKAWNDGDDEESRPDTIAVELWRSFVPDLGEGEVGMPAPELVETSDSFGSADDWEYTFSDLPMYNEGGYLYMYYVVEVPVEGYASDINDFVITNTPLIDIDVEKVWVDDDNDEGLRPDAISVVLYQDYDGNSDEPIALDSVELDDDNDWSFTFTDLPLYSSEGDAYIYWIEEVEVEAGDLDDYVSAVTGNAIDGFVIVNSLDGDFDINVVKFWIDEGDDEERPDTITVRLWRSVDGEDAVEVDAVTFGPDEDDNWAVAFTGLPLYDEDGKVYAYSITEDAVEGYLTFIFGNPAAGYTISNSRDDQPPLTPPTPTPTETPTPTPTPRIPDERIPQTGEGSGSNGGKWMGLFLLGTAAVVAYSKRRLGQVVEE